MERVDYASVFDLLPSVLRVLEHLKTARSPAEASEAVSALRERLQKCHDALALAPEDMFSEADLLRILSHARGVLAEKRELLRKYDELGVFASLPSEPAGQ